MKHTLILSTLMLFSSAALSLDVKLTETKDYVEVVDNGKLVKVQRIQDQEHRLEGGFAKTSRKCPPFCIQPMSAGEGVGTIGQLEVIEFMEKDLLGETGILVDARTPAWYKKGTIPGSTNIPFSVFGKAVDEPELIEAMRIIGAKRRSNVSDFERSIEKMGFMGGDYKNDTWDFTSAKKLVLWCNGPWCG